MWKWIAITGCLIWAAGTSLIYLSMTLKASAKPIQFSLVDGTKIFGTLYRSPPKADWRLRSILNSEGLRPGVVVVHGTAVSERIVARPFAIPLAENGFVALAIDLRGHGNSEGSLPKSDFKDILNRLNSVGDYPEVHEAVEFLKKQSGVDPNRITLVGHSRGGWAAASVGFERSDVRSVVSVGAAPGLADERRPANFMIMTGGKESLCTVELCERAMLNATGGKPVPEDQLFGDFLTGTARKMAVVTRANHVTEIADPAISRRIVQWFGSALQFGADDVPGEWLFLMVTGVLSATLGGAVGIAGFIHRICAGSKFSRERQEDRRSQLFSTTLSAVSILMLASGTLVLASPLAAMFSSVVEIGPAWFAGPCVVLMGSAALILGLFAGFVRRFTHQSQPDPLARTKVSRDVCLGIIGLGLAFLWFGLPWGLSWLDLVPTARRLLLGMALFLLLLPICRAVSAAIASLTSVLNGTSWIYPVRFTLLLAIPYFLWLGHEWFTVSKQPLFTIPVWLVGGSFLLPIPLWMIPDRPGINLSRSICHSGGAAWLLACHLPFVHSG